MDNIYYYRHKETKATVSVEYLKELNKNGNWIAFHNDLYYSQLNDEMSEPKLFTYRVSEIPFSDEFELVTLPDNEELEFLYEVRDYLSIVPVLEVAILIEKANFALLKVFY